MKPLTMSDAEIIRRYKQGASARILADLNACGWDRIKTIVGEPIEHKENKPRGHIDEKRARDLHAEGKTDKEMAAGLGVSRGAVALWRSRRGFEANKREEGVMEMNLNKLMKANIPESIETVSDAGQMIEEVGKCFEEVEPCPEPATIGHYKKPPLGVMSRHHWDEKRKIDIGEAITRYIEAGAQLPAEWVIEWNERCEG